jgi:molybdate transport system substrate-binding protein
VLKDSRVRRIAIANPAHAPYGRAALAALRHEKLYEAVQGKLVLGENISQAAQFVESGNADAGIIALSLALGPALRARGTYVPIPAAASAPIRQAGVVINTSRSKATAHQFIAYLKRPEIIQMLERFGLYPPQGAGR